jgi:hypothetical protein
MWLGLCHLVKHSSKTAFTVYIRLVMAIFAVMHC